MIRMVCGAAAIATATGTAAAADFPPYGVPEPLRAYSWIGPYLGGRFGYQWGSITHNPTRPAGITGGLRGGYNWQWLQQDPALRHARACLRRRPRRDRRRLRA